jgi:hypothetical protein
MFLVDRLPIEQFHCCRAVCAGAPYRLYVWMSVRGALWASILRDWPLGNWPFGDNVIAIVAAKYPCGRPEPTSKIGKELHLRVADVANALWRFGFEGLYPGQTITSAYRFSTDR